MEKTIKNHPVKVTLGTLGLLAISIAYNFFGGGIKIANAMNNIASNDSRITAHVLETDEKFEKVIDRLDRVYEGLLVKGIIEPRK